MAVMPLDMVFVGLSITSSWGNGHATTYRALLRQLAAQGHNLLFLERDVPWYAANRDLANPPYCRTELYESVEDLTRRFQAAVARADVVVVGSYVPDGIKVGDWLLQTAGGVVAFYDIDTPVTLACLRAGGCDYLSAEQVRQYDLYLSFSGGSALRHLERDLGSPRARALYCSVDTDLYYPEEASHDYDLGYLGTYSVDRQPKLASLLLEPALAWKAGRFIVAGPQYPEEMTWPENVERIEHLAPGRHRAFYAGQRFTLNLTRADMIRAGYAPSVRLFEAAACGVPVISDDWEGLDTFFVPGEEILLASDARDVLRILRETGEAERRAIGRAGRARILRAHTSRHRAGELIEYVAEARAGRRADVSVFV